ncbi:MAG TPA: choline monooxygenase, partial [Blastocatellia bacterium]|nr:choline monooxygenase [Blastocatellia bacterium]
QMRHISSRSYEVNAHWALYCENYLEGFHIPFVHRALNELVDYGSYSTETFRYSSLQTAFPARTGSADSNTAGTRFEATADSTNGGASAYYLFVFPNLMFNFYPWGISVNVVKPVAPEKTVVEFLTFVSDEEKLGGGAGSDLHRVEMEDEAVVESVQRGIKSRFYSRGRYSPKSERGLHHFHRLIAEFLDS